MDLSIIIPTYNEKENIAILIPKIISFFNKKKLTCEIIVVDDNSPDGTGDTVLELKKKFKNINLFVREKKEGIGSALRFGYNRAKGKYILSTDADLSFKVEDMGKLYDKIIQGYDLVTGSRHARKGYYEKNALQTATKGTISFMGNRLFSFLFNIPVTDFSANFRIIKNKTWKKIKTKEQTNFLLFEMIFKIHIYGGRVTEVPVAFIDRKYGESKLNLYIEAPKALVKLALYFIKYKIGLIQTSED